MRDNLDLLPTWEFGNVLGRLPVGDERVAGCKRIIKAHEAALRHEISSLVSALEEIRDTVNDPREIAVRALARAGGGWTSEAAALREALRSLARIETDEEGLPVLVISCGWHCQTTDQTELPLVWAALSRPALTGNGEKP